MSALVVFCALFFIQSALCQILAPGNIGYPNRMGPGNNINFDANNNAMANNFAANNAMANNFAANNAIANNIAANTINGLPMAGISQGYGDVSVIGELPVVGNTAISGNVPVMGYVIFEGTVPAGGFVSVANNCDQNI